MVSATLLRTPCSLASVVARSAAGGDRARVKVSLPLARSRTPLQILNTGCGPKYYRGGSLGSCAPGANEFSSSYWRKRGPYVWGRTLKEFVDHAEKMMEGSESFGEREWEFTMPFPIDTQADSSAYTIFADLPGLTKEDIKIRVTKRTLDITAERRRPPVDEEEAAGARRRFRRSERVFGKFGRRLELPEDVDVKGISARCEDGVLTVVVQRVAKEEPDVQDIPIA